MATPLEKLRIPAKRVSPCLRARVFRACFGVCAPVSRGALPRCHLQPDKPKDLSPSELPLSGG